MGKERLCKRDVKIDGRNRIVIPSELLEEMKLKQGNLVNVYADFDEMKIIIKGGKNERKK